MKVYSFSEARQNLASILDEASRNGVVRINRRDGQAFVLTPVAMAGSPLNITGVNIDISKKEIIDIVREGRERTY